MTKERPILFSAPMVRALLAGAKTQTRRVLRDQDPVDLGAITHGAHLARRPRFDRVANAVIGHALVPVICPYGVPGDRLWVREAWARDSEDGALFYRADVGSGNGADVWQHNIDVGASGYRWKPSIHMPRAASRITLEVTGVRVERLQAITRGDCMAEGCPFPNMAKGPDPREWYAVLWESINGPDTWARDPWVWVVDFKRMESKA